MKQKIYVFGNPDYSPDSTPIRLTEKIFKWLPDVEIVMVKPNEDLPFEHKEHVCIVDTVEGIDKVTFITESNIDSIQLPPRYSAHDFDLGFQLKYLMKLGKILQFTIVGIPIAFDVNDEDSLGLCRTSIMQALNVKTG